MTTTTMQRRGRTGTAPHRSNSMVIFRQEVTDLWLSAKGLSVLFGFTLLLSLLSYLASADAGINLVDARESVGVIVQTSIGLGTLRENENEEPSKRCS